MDRTSEKRRAPVVAAFLCLVCPLMEGARALEAQASADPTDEEQVTSPADSLRLVFEREVFTYPDFLRRDPFAPPTGDEASGPRFEDMVLLGVMLDSDPQQSIAIMGARPPGATVDQPATRTYRLRPGESLGNMRILDVAQREVLVEVADFGVRDTRRLSMQRYVPPPLPPEPEVVPEQDPPAAPVDAPPPGDQAVLRGGWPPAPALTPGGVRMGGRV